jgi:hypothetical protein
MDSFRIGIIGAGSIVEGNHLPAIHSLGNAGISWIFDKNPERMALTTKMYGIPSLSDRSMEEALAEVDVCLLATPYGTRKPYIEMCRKAGISLVVEKPFAFSRQEHLSHCNGFETWKIAVNFQRRFYRSVGVARKIVQEKIFGDLRAVRFAQGNFTLKGGSGYLSSAELAGGGVIAESASHILDIILMLTDAEDIRLLKCQSLHAAGLDYDTVFDSEMIVKGDKIPVNCEITTLRNLSNGLFLDFDHALVGWDLSPDGKIFLYDRKSNRLQFTLFQEPSAEELYGQATKVNEAFLIFWQQFLHGLQHQKANRTSAYGSLLTSAWMEEIYKKINLS